jgi:uncharacterized peroxidase-related enzyme
MAYIKLCKYEEMLPEIRERAKPILEKSGQLGEIFELLALDKDLYFATDMMVQNFLLKETLLPYSTKERIALLVSLENNCTMCVDVHKNIAKMLGMTEAQVEETLQGIDALDIDEKEKTLLRLALKAADKENYKTTQEDIDRVTAAGWSEAEILEAVRIAAYFNYINTLSNIFGLGKEV